MIVCPCMPRADPGILQGGGGVQEFSVWGDLCCLYEVTTGED